MKKRTLLFLVLITVISLILRLKNITRPDGLWYDELFTYYVSMQNFPAGILEKLASEDFHAPLFFFLLHGWISLFSDSDVSLRILPVLISTAWIPAIYCLGEEVNSAKNGDENASCCYETGIIAAVLVSFNTFAVFYSQEVRFYSLAGLFVILSCLFFIKMLKTNEPKYYTLLGLVNVLLAYTLTYAVIFVFIQGLAAFWLVRKEKTALKKTVAAYLLTAILWLPFAGILLKQFNTISHSIFRSFEWYVYTPKSWIFTYISWFEPYVSEDFMKNIMHPNALPWQAKTLYLIVLVFIFGFISYKIFRSKNRYTAALLGILIVFSTTQIFFAMSGKLPFIPRYTLTIYPLFAVLFAYALALTNKKITYPLIVIMAGFSLYFMLLSPYSKFWNMRGSGYGLAADYLKTINTTREDKFLLVEGSNIFSKYTNMTPLNINATDLIYISKRDVLENVFGEETAGIVNKNNSNEIIRKYINSNTLQSANIKYFNEEIAKLKPGQRFIIISFMGKYDIDYAAKSLFARTNNAYSFQKEESRHSLLIAKINLDYITLALNSPDLILKDEKRFRIWNVMVFEKI